MATMKEQMESAKAFIKAGQFEDARRILKRVDHPKAREWENKLPKPKRNYLRWVLIAFIVVGIVIASLQYMEMRRQAAYINDLVDQQIHR